MINDNTKNWLNLATGAGFEGADGFLCRQSNADSWILENCGSGQEADYVTDISLMGNKAAYIYDSVSCPAGSTGCGGIRLLMGYTFGDIYHSAYVRYAGYWPTQYMKMVETSGRWYFQPEMKGGSDPTRMWLISGPNELYANLPTPLKKQSWHYWEIHLRVSPPLFEAWWDGTKIATWNPPSGGQTSNWEELGIPNYSGSGAYIKMWIDRAVYSSSRIYPASTIEIGNSPTYGSGVKKWQEPIHLSDTSIQVKIDLSGLGKGPYYLWVTNNEQERSSPLKIDTGSEDLPPSPPSGLTILQ
jgi:hypothetical protein